MIRRGNVHERHHGSRAPIPPTFDWRVVKPRKGRSWLAGAVLGGGVGVVVDLPSLLTGALAVSIGQDFSFGSTGLGAAIGMSRGVAALSSVWVGRIADRIGSTNALRLATAAAAMSSGSIALFATNWALLAAGLVVAGLAIALGHPAANRLLSMNVRPDRQGVAFGIKQSAPAVASLIAGLSVPIVAVSYGWRSAFGLGAAAAVAMLFVIGRRPAVSSQAVDPAPTLARGGRAFRRGMTMLGVGFGLATAAAVVVPAFYVNSAVRAGTPVARAGMLLAVASGLTVIVRLSLGVVAGRMAKGHFPLCGALVASGAIVLVLLGNSNQTIMAAGVFIATPTIWGFNGVFWYAVIRIAGDRPGAVTGLMAPGGHVGGSLGPVVFGITAALVGYSLTWILWTAVALSASAAMFAAAGILDRSSKPLKKDA